ncbi:MAG: DAK2 domain-containing protein [Firmicutes bacterium]|nr:DAK2 domain-containing protein [Bacillota bacterium]
MKAIDGPVLAAAFESGVAWLGEHKSLIDSLNVFPVPDGDTGTNMYLTVSAALKEAEKAGPASVADVADAIALGSLMGARGNSGVILSQLLRGFAKRLHGLKTAEPMDLAAAFQEASNVAYKAVMKPVEGTILTVARVGARAGVQAARSGADIFGVVDEVLKQGEIVLEKTPEMLPALKEAGVVDAGGKGLVVLFQGFAKGLRGEPIERVADVPADDRVVLKPGKEPARTKHEIEYAYCTELIIRGSELDPDAVKRALLDDIVGDSMLVVGDSNTVKVHMHSNTPGRILEICIGYGSLHEIDIDNMEDQHEEFEGAAGKESGLPVEPHEEEPRELKDVGVVAVAAGDGVEKILKSLGADVVITGGQTMNPSIQDVADGVRRAYAREVIVLPNNGNVVLTAQQAAGVPDIGDTKVHVVPSKTVPQGLAALLVMTPYAPLEDNVAKMVEAIGRVVSAEITYAVRDSTFNGIEIHENDIIGIIDGDLQVVGESVDEVVRHTFAEIQSANHEIATIIYGFGVTQEEAESLASGLAEEYPDIEFEVQYGGQPLYYYLISVE